MSFTSDFYGHLKKKKKEEEEKLTSSPAKSSTEKSSAKKTSGNSFSEQFYTAMSSGEQNDIAPYKSQGSALDLYSRFGTKQNTTNSLTDIAPTVNGNQSGNSPLGLFAATTANKQDERNKQPKWKQRGYVDTTVEDLLPSVNNDFIKKYIEDLQKYANDSQAEEVTADNFEDFIERNLHTSYDLKTRGEAIQLYFEKNPNAYQKDLVDYVTSAHNSVLKTYNSINQAEDDYLAQKNADEYKFKFAPGAQRTWFKSSEGNVGEAILGTAADIFTDLGTGLVGMGEAAVDALVAVAPYIIQGQYYANGGGYNIQADQAFNDAVGTMKAESEKFVEKDLYDEEAVSKQIIGSIASGFNVTGQKQDVMDYLDNEMEGHSVLGEKSDALVQSAGALGGQMISNAVLPGSGMVLMGTTAFGSEAENALKNGATLDEAAFSGLVSAGAEILSEKLGGISFGGQTLTDVAFKKLSGRMTGKLSKVLLTTGKLAADATSEGLEEVFSGYMGAIGQKLSYMEDKEIEELFSSDDALESFIGGLVLGTMGNVGGVIQSNKHGVDYVTGLTKNEQAVVDKIYKDLLSEAEKNGKVSGKDKSEIYQKVLEDLEKGGLDTDKIEEVLGGKTYEDYKATLESEDSVLKEFESLYEGDELKRQTEDFLKDSKRYEAKDLLSKEVYEQVKDGKLGESYRERARRSESFTADLSQYDTKYHTTIQNAINSGTLNNTRRTHELVDMIAKISADKGVLFDFTNNEKIKGTSFAVEGKIVNGYVTESGDITLNVESPKYLNTTVGHEITHVLEGTDFYNTLQETIFEYAKSKNDYNDRLASLRELYKGVKGYEGVDGFNKIKNELTADLVGDYLFTDSDFVHKLSTEHRNIFQKIYDEIKYLCKVATAGSKEARQLEKVKKTFEEAYRGESKAKGETKHSLSDADYLSPQQAQVLNVMTSNIVNEATRRGISLEQAAIATQEINAFNPTKADAKTFADAFEPIVKQLGNENYYGYLDKMRSYAESESDTKYSLSDSEGRQLSKEQSEYFKDSKIRDANGSLMVMYHGTPNGDYTVFKDGTYFTPNKEYADKYQNPGASSLSVKQTASNPKTFEVYLDIKKPFDISNAEARRIYIEDYIKGGNAIGINPYLSDAEYAKINTIDWTEGEDLRDFLVENDYGYDGLILDEGATGGYGDEVKSRGKSYVVFSPEQVKNVDNKAPTSDPDIRFSLSESVEETHSKSYAEITEEQQKLYQRERQLAERKREATNNPELLQAMDDYTDLFTEMRSLLPKKRTGTATQAELDRIEELKALQDERMNRVAELQESLGLNAILQEETEIRETKEALRLAADAAWAREGAEKENKAIEKAGLTAPEYFRKKALKAFKTTTNFNEAGYMLPDGKLLNFSGGERNHRYRDHREIGEIYEATQGVAALNRFLSDGNIRIMAESPGIDLASGVEPTKEQYAALRKFINTNGVKDGQFFVDFSGTDGRNVDKYAYQGRIFADRIINDIKYFFQTGKVRESSGITDFLSLSNVGEQPRKFGNFNISGKDVMLESAPVVEKPVSESVAPVTEVTEVTDMFPDNAQNLDSLLEEQSNIRNALEYAASQNDIDTVNRLLPEYESVSEKVKEMQDADNQRLASLDDADVPPEMDAPYYGEPQESVTPDDPFADRDWYKVGNQKVKSFMDENPIVKPFFQDEARAMHMELSDTTKGERWYDDRLYYESGGEKGFGGVSRHTSDSIAEMLDSWHLSYADIEKGLNEIIEDSPRKSAAAKKIEFMLNDRLLHGYKDYYSNRMVSPNQEYINLLNQIQTVEYSPESLDNLVAHADEYAPFVEDIAPAPVAENVAPVKEAYEAIKPKQSKEPRMARATKEEQARDSRTAKILFDQKQTPKQKSAWKWAREHIFSRGAVFEDMSLKTGNRELQAKFDNIRRAESRAQTFMGKGKGDAKALVDVRKMVEDSGKTEDFNYYLYHLHNVDRMTLEQRFKDVPNKSVFGDSVDAETSRKAALGLEVLNPEFKQWAEDVYAINRHLRQMMVDEGVISQETADLWQTMYPHYVPISRADAKGLNVNVPLDTKRTGINAPIKKATGGNSDFYNVFDTMGSRIEQTYKAIAKNRFGVELMNTLGTAYESDVADIDTVLDTMDQHEELLQEGKNGERPSFTVFQNGERVKFAITEDMYDAMKPSQFTYTNKALKKINDIRRDILTTYSPTFALTNPIKDVQDILLNSQHPARTYATIPEAVYSVISKNHWYQERMENGGNQDSYFDGQTKTFKKEDGWFKKVVGYLPSKIQAANEIIEQVPRMAEYIASRKMGRSIDVSMLDAARVTTNFGAPGDFTNMLNRNGFTFLGASVEGFNQQVRNVREAKAEGLKGWAKLAGKYLVAGLPAMLLNHLLWDDDEEYEELSDYVKQNYYVVGKTEDGKFVRIPKGRAVSVIQDAFNQMENLITGNDDVDLESFGQLVVNNLAPNNPLENNLIAPIAQAVTNKTWYGDDLVPTRLQDVPVAEQFDETTDSISKWLGEATNTSPYKWNYLLDQYTGGVGDMVLPYLTPEADGGGLGAAFRDKFVSDPVLKNQNVTDFYDKVDELTVNANSSKATDEDILMSKYMSSVNSEMGKLYQQKREIQNSNLSDEEKYAQVRDIQRQIDDLARESLATYENVNIDNGYATIGDSHYRWYEPGEDSNAEPGWQKISDKQLEKQEKVTSALGIDGAEYWSNKEEYDFAYESPEKYAVAKAVGGYTTYKTYSSELYDIKADKDSSGKTISGSRKEKVLDYINNLDADYGEKLILFKSEYNADDTYNYEIIDYLNSRDDIDYEEMETILKELGFNVSSNGTITWD